MNKNVKILVCCHKKDLCETNEPYYPIHVGKAVHPEVDLGIQCDNEGDNISEKNGSYCELTGLYWAWKNLKDVDVIGLCHYRRYFDFHNQCQYPFPCVPNNSGSLDNVDLSIPDDIIEKVSQGDVVMSRPVIYPYSLQLEYCSSQLSTDFQVLKEHFDNLETEEMRDAFYEVMYRGNKMSPFNMFIMSWKDFDAYCSWLFPLLADVESKIDITHYSTMQKRVFGFMAERLMCVYMTAKKKNKVIHKPVLWFSNSTINYSPVLRFVLDRVYNFSFMLWRKPLSTYKKQK